MALFNNFPWTNFHELNLDWIIKKVKEIDAAFPEGLVGVSKGGTGADNAADARTNLEIAGDTIPFESAIPGQSISEYVGIISDNLANIADELTENLNYKIFRSVSSLPNITAGTATIVSCWYAMSPGEILIAPHTDFAPAEIPSSYGVVFIVRAANTNGMVRYFGNRTYEMPLVSNVPDGVWRQLRQSGDIVPIESGGTGANNAADARTNLGIDFSGTVLSVAGVGADTAGNVPLKLDNLVYNSISELGLASGSTLSAVWTALPNNSLLIANASEISNPPVNNSGSLEIYKGTSSVPGFIRFHGKESATGDYAMYLNASGAPSGTWEETGGAGIDFPSNNSIKFANGIIIAWGSVVVTTGTTGANATFTYRGTTYQGLSDYGISNCITAYTNITDSAGFWNSACIIDNGNTLIITAAGNNNATKIVYWLAIGT